MTARAGPEAVQGVDRLEVVPGANAALNRLEEIAGQLVGPAKAEVVSAIDDLRVELGRAIALAMEPMKAAQENSRLASVPASTQWEQIRARTLLAHLWRTYDTAGVSMGRSHQAVVLEAALALLGDPDPADMAVLDEDSGRLINDTRSHLSRKMWERFSRGADACAPPAGQGDAAAIARAARQGPSYTIVGKHLVDDASGEPIPHDEPVFIIRARDKVAVRSLLDHAENVGRQPSAGAAYAAVRKRIKQFRGFASRYPDRMRSLGSTSVLAASGQEDPGADGAPETEAVRVGSKP